jgi:hypothetical protein
LENSLLDLSVEHRLDLIRVQISIKALLLKIKAALWDLLPDLETYRISRRFRR